MLTVFPSSREISCIIYKVEAIIIPTTAACMPSCDLYMAAYFFRLLQIGKKKRTSNAEGRNMAMDPTRHPNNCI